MAYGSFKDLTQRTVCDKVLRDKAFDVAKFMFYRFFDKKTSGGALKCIPNQQHADKLHKPIIRKFRKTRLYSSFKDNYN